MACTYCYCDSATSSSCIEVATPEFCSCLNTAVNSRNDICKCVVENIDRQARTGKSQLDAADVDEIK
ncbi:hypothetical protein, partial [Salmonella sp. s54836]|uniref:hypothetical protein n=1 Tax=Salmonella sp. s54836 TaxID=3159673 RepID=UPI0039808721